jgi:hypothetical protein
MTVVGLVSFMDYDLGFFDKEKGRVEPAPNPFGPDKVLTMSPEWTLLILAEREGFEPSIRY